MNAEDERLFRLTCQCKTGPKQDDARKALLEARKGSEKEYVFMTGTFMNKNTIPQRPKMRHRS